ncbi:MAG: threonine-phosphate decarboxylase CobD [Pseudomonadota bacterium]
MARGNGDTPGPTSLGTPSAEDDHARATRSGTIAHGGDLERARRAYGGARAEWLDLSTGVNPTPYPAEPPPLGDPVWSRLPDTHLTAAFADAARGAWNVAARAEITPCAGAQAAIQAIPRILAVGAEPRSVAIVSPTYAEHASAFAAAGWRVSAVDGPDAAAASDVHAAVIVNPNNPDGRRWPAAALLGVADRLAARGGALIVDESFGDLAPELSLCPVAAHPAVIVLKSLGKFHGLAGLRVGATLAAPSRTAELRRALGPWPVSGPALAMGAQALADRPWAEAMRRQLSLREARLRDLGERAGWTPAGGCGLFMTFEMDGPAAAAQAELAAGRIWTRVFPYHPNWIRLGAPGSEQEWERLDLAQQKLRELARRR